MGHKHIQNMKVANNYTKYRRFLRSRWQKNESPLLDPEEYSNVHKKDSLLLPILSHITLAYILLTCYFKTILIVPSTYI